MLRSRSIAKFAVQLNIIEYRMYNIVSRNTSDFNLTHTIHTKLFSNY